MQYKHQYHFHHNADRWNHSAAQAQEEPILATQWHLLWSIIKPEFEVKSAAISSVRMFTPVALAAAAGGGALLSIAAISTTGQSFISYGSGCL